MKRGTRVFQLAPIRVWVVMMLFAISISPVAGSCVLKIGLLLNVVDCLNCVTRMSDGNPPWVMESRREVDNLWKEGVLLPDQISRGEFAIYDICFEHCDGKFQAFAANLDRNRPSPSTDPETIRTLAEHTWLRKHFVKNFFGCCEMRSKSMG